MSGRPTAEDVLSAFVTRRLWRPLAELAEDLGCTPEDLDPAVAELEARNLAVCWPTAPGGPGLALTPASASRPAGPARHAAEADASPRRRTGDLGAGYRVTIVATDLVRHEGDDGSRRPPHDAAAAEVPRAVVSESDLLDRGEFDLDQVPDPRADDPAEAVLAEETIVGEVADELQRAADAEGVELPRRAAAEIVWSALRASAEGTGPGVKRPDYDRTGRLLPEMRVYLGSSSSWPREGQDRRPGPSPNPREDPRLGVRRVRDDPLRLVAARPDRFAWRGRVLDGPGDYLDARGEALLRRIECGYEPGFEPGEGPDGRPLAWLVEALGWRQAALERLRADCAAWRAEAAARPAPRPRRLCWACGGRRLGTCWYCLPCDRSGVDALLPLLTAAQRRLLENQRKGRDRDDGLKGGRG